MGSGKTCGSPVCLGGILWSLFGLKQNLWRSIWFWKNLWLSSWSQGTCGSPVGSGEATDPLQADTYSSMIGPQKIFSVNWLS
jgi:hypothetical protein